MKFDIFLSICQTEVDGYTPTERVMFENFFDQVRWADSLGYETAWVAETHLSCQTQKKNADAVIPHFRGEIGLNTDILQLAHLVMAQTKRINVGSAIRNILCNGGPMAHAEAVRTFLTLHALQPCSDRILELGFAAGRFPFSNVAYGIRARNQFEAEVWNELKGKVFHQATEIFLRFLKGERFSSKSVSPLTVSSPLAKQWSNQDRPATVLDVSGENVTLKSFFEFDEVGVIPFEAPLDKLRLTIGSHDPLTQVMANEYLPTGVFNLSITPPPVIEATHERMRTAYHTSGGPWRRHYMPRTVLLFLDKDSRRAKDAAEKAWRNYWVAMEKTLDPRKVETAVNNAIAGNSAEVAAAIQEKYHPEDRLMLWFDFNNHDNAAVIKSMQLFMEEVAPQLPLSQGAAPQASLSQRATPQAAPTQGATDVRNAK